MTKLIPVAEFFFPLEGNMIFVTEIISLHLILLFHQLILNVGSWS